MCLCQWHRVPFPRPQKPALCLPEGRTTGLLRPLPQKEKNPKHSVVNLEMILRATHGLLVYTQVTSMLGVQMRGSPHEQGLTGNFWTWPTYDYYWEGSLLTLCTPCVCSGVPGDLGLFGVLAPSWTTRLLENHCRLWGYLGGKRLSYRKKPVLRRSPAFPTCGAEPRHSTVAVCPHQAESRNGDLVLPSPQPQILPRM